MTRFDHWLESHQDEKEISFNLSALKSRRRDGDGAKSQPASNPVGHAE